MHITNVKSTYVPGFENPYTSFTISPEPAEDESSGGSKRSFRGIQFLNTAGDGYGPHQTTLGDIADKIPPKPSLKPSCEKCRKRPDQEGSGFPNCASCKVSRYCSRECQTSHWKEHKKLCQRRVKYAELERDIEAKALSTNGPFVSQAALRKWYYDNVDIVEYTIVQALELYKGPRHNLWRTHAVIISLKGGKLGTSVAASEMSFSDAEEGAFTTLARPDRLSLTAVELTALGAGSRIIVIFVLNNEFDLKLVESYDLPSDEEWAEFEKDDMWRMHIRMRKMAQMMAEKDSAEESN
ncbi:MYND-type domain-containing protein [Mycena venus]|uniref:MYND-type domain-containing protein n=1 Tax=Mycena venus TaxID=2733690 RepID=A0A8H6WX04_9AGAR|nr:MYND-type domain-containing protein [Mycena venus]